MGKKTAITISILLVVLSFIILSLFIWPEIKKENEAQICVQAITEAINPKTGEKKIFGTPCEVPEGWNTIQPESHKIGP